MSIFRHAFAAIYDPFLALGERRGMADRRRDLLAGARGRVLELGAGTGLNLPYYDDAAELTLTEPDPGMARILERRVGRDRPAAEVVRAGAEDLPFADGTFDVAVSTLVLCTVPDPEAAVAELRRVLRPGGHLLYVEHVHAEDGALGRWQERLAAPWAAFAAGCRCDRHTLDLLDATFMLDPPDRAEWRGMPRIVRPLALGAAVRT
jgi:SAM-dependent methyltransferase